MLAVMQNFTQTAIAWVGLVGVRLDDFLPRKGDNGRGADGGGVWGSIVLLIFPLLISEGGILTPGPQTSIHKYCWFLLVPNENENKRRGLRLL